MPAEAASTRRMAEVPRATWLGIAASLALYLCASTFSAITLPWKGTADAYAHLDYVYQVHLGRIPDAHGYAYRKVSPRKFNVPNAETSRQWASAHPPLFYAIASLPMGAPLDTGDWETAMARGRALNVALGFACVLALAWAGWTLGGERRARLAVALPAVGGMLPTFIRFAAEIYNDVLVTLFSILAMVLSCLILRDGARQWLVAVLAVVCAFGMASKATFVFALVIAVGSVSLSVAAKSAGPPGRRVVRGGLAGAALAAIAFLPNAWFYLRNVESSGSWFRSTAKQALQGRVEKSLADVMTDADYWLLVPRGLLGPAWTSAWPFNQQASIVLACACGAGLLYLACAGRWTARLRALEPTAWWWLVIAAHFAGLMVAQLHQATGWGQYNVRYFLPALLSMGMFLVAAACARLSIARWTVPPLSALMAFATVAYATTYLDRAYPSLAAGRSSWIRLRTAVDGNGFAEPWAWILPAGMIISVAAIAIALARLREGTQPE